MPSGQVGDPFVFLLFWLAGSQHLSMAPPSTGLNTLLPKLHRLPYSPKEEGKWGWGYMSPPHWSGRDRGSSCPCHFVRVPLQLTVDVMGWCDTVLAPATSPESETNQREGVPHHWAKQLIWQKFRGLDPHYPMLLGSCLFRCL